MTTTTPVQSIEPATACSVDRSCATAIESTCGCNTSAAGSASSSKRGARAALLAVACAAGCLTVPLVAGGAAAASGVRAGERWIVALAVIATIVGTTVMRRRQARTGNACC